MNGERGQWMQTFNGGRFYPLAPRPDEVHAIDIAHALARVCRYGGHVIGYYSVAEHCVLMSHAVSPENALWALLHDAPEAYVGDMVRPLKRMIPEYSAIEDRVMAAIATRFGLLGEMPAEVKEADNRIILAERARLMPQTADKWMEDGLTPLPVVIHEWFPLEAERQYYRRLRELT